MKLLLVMALLQGMTAYAGEVRSNGYTVRFDERIETAPGDLHGETVGGIRLVRTADQALVWQENTPLRPGCGNVAAVTAINDRYMALCGHLGGRHYTQKIIFTQGSSLSMASVDQYDSPSPVRVERNGSLAIDVLRRDLFPGELTGPHYFPTVYRLRHDDAMFGFLPSFDGDVAERYWLHYRATRQAAPAAEVLPELLASLLAAQSGKQSICAELDTLAADLQQGRQYDAQGARTLMRTWLHKLPAVGYPAFDTQACPDRI
ncbi:hypothetical protein SAMN05216517_102558 [Janthinobacterium sp. OK676]|uniref:hypothetical protein n=1 Tax=Janthinobacterium sp. OK676 TaxID=1855295 RepID=UPI0008827536|nr:hypothetical protein [Janthinobacterium sp. OK676]SDL97212.1 hypothetical protein SAMN05216517_102558 [Janthinobacterium sp. OK676]